MSLKEFLEEKVDGSYLAALGGDSSYCPIQQHKDDVTPPPLRVDVPLDDDMLLKAFPNFIKLRDRREASFDSHQFFMTFGKSATEFHYDGYENLYFVVGGKKIWTLAPPWLLPFWQDGGENKSHCEDQPHNQHFTKPVNGLFPYITIELNAGDVLLLPSVWLHLVQSEPDERTKMSCAFNFFWNDRFQQKIDDNRKRFDELCMKHSRVTLSRNENAAHNYRKFDPADYPGVSKDSLKLLEASSSTISEKSLDALRSLHKDKSQQTQKWVPDRSIKTGLAPSAMESFLAQARLRDEVMKNFGKLYAQPKKYYSKDLKRKL